MHKVPEDNGIMIERGAQRWKWLDACVFIDGHPQATVVLFSLLTVTSHAQGV